MNRSIRTLATTPSRGSDQSSAMQLSIYCRKGRTELVVVGPAISGHVEDYAVSYRINGNDPVQIAGGCRRLEPAPEGRRRALVAVVARGGRHRRPTFLPQGWNP